MQTDNVRHLLWTGGWDSTFRLVQLLDNGERVQPHYLISPDRNSLGAELVTQQKIRKALAEKHPRLVKNLLPTKYGIVTELKKVPEITAAWERLRQRTYLGAQYKFLGWYCANSGIDAFDAGFQNSGGALYRHLDTFLTKNKAGMPVMDPIFADREEYIIFHFYTYEIWNTSKNQMQQIAGEKGFLDVMQMTWFCHNPRPNMQPCGRCNPCNFVLEEGMAWRLPWQSKVRHYFPSRAMARRLVISHAGLYRIVQRWRSRLAA